MQGGMSLDLHEGLLVLFYFFISCFFCTDTNKKCKKPCKLFVVLRRVTKRPVFLGHVLFSFPVLAMLVVFYKMMKMFWFSLFFNSPLN